MQQLKRITLALAVSLLAAAAQADGDRSALFRCGFHVGGTPQVKKADNEPRQRSDFGLPQEVRWTETKTVDPISFSDTGTRQTGRRRMPPTFTVANFSCTWR